MADEEAQSLRSLIGRRVELGRSAAEAKNRIHGLLAINGIKEPSYSDLFGRMVLTSWKNWSSEKNQ